MGDVIVRLVVTFVERVVCWLFASWVGLFCGLYDCCVLWLLVLWVWVV